MDAEPGGLGRREVDSTLPALIPNSPEPLAPTNQESEPLTIEGPEQPGFSHIYAILARRKLTLGLITLCGVMVAAIVSAVQEPVYRVEVSLEVQGLNENFLNLRDVDPTAPVAPISMDSYIRTQAEILSNPALVDRVVGELRLDQRPEFTETPYWWGKFVQSLGLPAPQDLPPRERAVKTALDQLRVSPSRESRIIRVLFDCRDPNIAAEFANTLLREYREHITEGKWQTNTETREWLDTQMRDMKARLEQSERELQAYSRQAGLLLTAGRESIAEEKLRLIQNELSRAQGDRIARRSLVEMASSSPADALPPTLDTSSLRIYQTRLTELRRELAELSSLLQPENYKVMRVKAQIQEIEAAVRAEVAAIRSRVSNEYAATVAREHLLAAAYDQQAKAIEEQSAKAIHYNILLREVEANRQLYEGIIQRVREARIASAMRASNIRPIGLARPPAAPYRPNIPLNLSVGLATGLCAAIGFVLYREQANRQVHSPGEIGAWLNLHELGAIPRGEAPRAALGRATALLGGNKAPSKIELVTWERRLSHVSESFRNALASIVLAGREGGPRVLVITSAQPAEGKTTVASNLAISLAEIGRRVLLIDADMRDPRLQQVFDIDNSWGLSKLLQDRKWIQRAASSGLARDTKISRLSLLPSGPVPRSVPNLLHSPNLAELIQRLRASFDNVLIDAPPLLFFADARVLARHADGVILVVRANRTTKATLLVTVQRLREDGIPVLGAILNEWNPDLNGGYYGYRELRKYCHSHDHGE